MGWEEKKKKNGEGNGKQLNPDPGSFVLSSCYNYLN